MTQLSKFAAGLAVLLPLLLYRYIRSRWYQPSQVINSTPFFQFEDQRLLTPSFLLFVTTKQQPFSKLLEDVRGGRVAKVLLTAEFAYAWLHDASRAKPASYKAAIVKLFNHDRLFRLDKGEACPLRGLCFQ